MTHRPIPHPHTAPTSAPEVRGLFLASAASRLRSLTKVFCFRFGAVLHSRVLGVLNWPFERRKAIRDQCWHVRRRRVSLGATLEFVKVLQGLLPSRQRSFPYENPPSALLARPGRVGRLEQGKRRLPYTSGVRVSGGSRRTLSRPLK